MSHDLLEVLLVAKIENYPSNNSHGSQKLHCNFYQAVWLQQRLFIQYWTAQVAVWFEIR